MNELLKRDYFEKVWVIQKVFFATRIQVYCGKHNIGWDTFVAACHSFSSDRVVCLQVTLLGQQMYFGPGTLAETRGLKKVSKSELLSARLAYILEPYRSTIKLSFKLATPP